MRNISRTRREGCFDHQIFIICPTPPTIGHRRYPAAWMSDFDDAKVRNEKALLANLAPVLRMNCGHPSIRSRLEIHIVGFVRFAMPFNGGNGPAGLGISPRHVRDMLKTRVSILTDINQKKGLRSRASGQLHKYVEKNYIYNTGQQ